MNTLAKKLAPAWPRVDFWFVVTVITLAILFILLISTDIQCLFCQFF